jgi:hypothetical protein
MAMTARPGDRVSVIRGGPALRYPVQAVLEYVVENAPVPAGRADIAMIRVTRDIGLYRRGDLIPALVSELEEGA